MWLDTKKAPPTAFIWRVNRAGKSGIGPTLSLPGSAWPHGSTSPPCRVCFHHPLPTHRTLTPGPPHCPRETPESFKKQTPAGAWEVGRWQRRPLFH